MPLRSIGDATHLTIGYLILKGTTKALTKAYRVNCGCIFGRDKATAFFVFPCDPKCAVLRYIEKQSEETGNVVVRIGPRDHDAVNFHAHKKK